MSELPRISSWQRLVQRLIAIPPVTRFFEPILVRADMALLRRTGYRHSFTSLLAGFPIVILTTTGAKSGVQRTLPLLGIPDGDNFILIASNFGRAHHPGWYYNLKLHPQASLKFNGRSGVYQARQAAPSELPRLWQIADKVYTGYPSYRRQAGARQIPIMVLEPQP